MPPRRLIRRPIKVRNPLQDLNSLVGLVAQLERMKDDLLTKLAEIETIKSGILKGDKGDTGPSGRSIVGPKGDKGDKGDAGISPSLSEVVATLASKLPKPKDGISPTIDYEKVARMAVAMIPKPKKQEQTKISVKDVEGISEALKEMLDKHKTYVHGGGDTVTAGTNVVITTDANGSKVINALGGTSGVNIETQYSLTSIQSGSDITVDLTQLTHWADFSNIVAVYLNNVPQTETLNFTVSGATLTIKNASDADVVNISYAYTP